MAFGFEHRKNSKVVKMYNCCVNTDIRYIGIYMLKD